MDITFVLLVVTGAFLGLVVGALPGLSVTMATAILVSLTYTWQTKNAIALIMGVYVVGVFSGAVSAILINIPGAPSSVATVLDGYPMAKKGRASLALHTATIYSFIGTVIGFGALWLFAKPISALAVKFSVLDYLLLGVLGLLSSTAVGSENKLKGLASGIFGLVLSCVGMDGIFGTQRLTFNLPILMGGISTVTALIGLFGLSEVLWQGAFKTNTQVVQQAKNEALPLKEILSHYKLGIVSSLIGTVVGALPGAGGPVASLIAYSHAKNTVKNNSVPFGQGAIEGVVASESANNACIGGALIPMLTLGIPGDAVTAVVLSVLILHGVKPGPFMISQNPQLFSAVLIGGLIGAVAVLVLGFIFNRPLAGLLKLDKGLLMPITLLCIVGAYSVSGNINDVWLMLIFGVMGFCMKLYKYPVAPLVLGLVLGQMCDLNLRRTVTIWWAQGGIVGLVFKRPITMVLLGLILITLYFIVRASGIFGGKNERP
ncbi:MAG: tripartite tricarboxylate transporter permease [Oscillospiraceae bacterium]